MDLAIQNALLVGVKVQEKFLNLVLYSQKSTAVSES